MDDQVLWGLLLMIYVIPFWVWQISAHSTVEVRRKLYPGRADEDKQESHFTNLGLLWSAGLVVLLVGWQADWHPKGAVVVLLGAGVLAAGFRFMSKRWNLMSVKLFRAWLAGSVVWVFAVGAWYLVFGRTSDLTNGECALLAFTAPLIAAFAIGGWYWALRKQ